MATRNASEDTITEKEIVDAVLRMRPSVRRRVLARLLRAASAAKRGPVASPRRRCRPSGEDLRLAFAATAGILKLDEDPVEWQRRIRAEWVDGVPFVGRLK